MTNLPGLTYERPYLYPKQLAAIFHDARYGFIEASAQPLHTMIPTPHGWRQFGDLNTGDYVFSVDGLPTEVSGVFPLGTREIFRLTFNDGVSTEACADHLWRVEQEQRGPKVLTTRELMKYSPGSRAHFLFPICEPVQYPYKPVKLDPWLVGALIGDGSLGGNAIGISSADLDLVERVKTAIPKGYEVKGGENYNYRIVAEERGAGYEKPSIRAKSGGFEVSVARTYIGRCDTYDEALLLHKEAMQAQYGSANIEINLRQELRELGLLGLLHNEKFVPDLYLYNTPEIRLEILRGILDTDGSAGSHNGAIIEQTSLQLSKNIEELVHGLGGFAKTTVTPPRQAGWKTSYRTNIRHYDVSQFFWLERKRSKPTPSNAFVRKLVDVTRIGFAEVQCIAISHPSSLYLTNDYIVTHNTKAGKTVACIVWLTEKALQGKKGQNFWWIAPSYNQAKIAFTRVGNCLTAGTFTENKTDMVITLPNGAVMQFKTGEMPDKLYGEDVWAAVVDEASRVREEAWVALRSTITATGGPVRAIGNVRGRKNWFFQMARIAEKGDNPHMRYAKLTVIDAIAAGVFSEDEAKDAAGMMSESAYKELYMAEPSDDGGNPFGGDLAIQACEIPEVLWENKPICWGWDLAKSVDWTVGIGLDSEGNVCRFYRWQKPWQETIAAISSFVGDVPTLIDATGVGDPVLEALQRQGNRKAIHGFKFSSSSKQQLMEGLAVAIQSQEVHFQHNPVGIELGLFEYQYTRTGVRYSAPDMTGVHDDCVCSLALAWKQYKKPPLPEWVQQTLSWRPKQLVNIYAR